MFTRRGASTSLAVTGDIKIGRQTNAAQLNLGSGTLTTNTPLTGQAAASRATSGHYRTGGAANLGNLRGGKTGASPISVAG